MYCSKCGAPIKEGAQFCSGCGTPVDAGSPAAPLRRTRPTVVTVLAVLKFVTAFVWGAAGLTLVGVSGGATNGTVLLTFGVICLVLGLLALACGHGLWTLRPHGWFLQVGLSIFGLLGFPLQTIISILILVYMFKPGVRVLFSGKPIERLGPVERAQLQSLTTGHAAAIVVAIVVAIPVGVAVMGMMAAIAVPNFLTAVDRGRQKRTMADLRAIGTALEAYAVDHNMYPNATTAAELQAAIEPRYIKAMPAIDGWGHAFEVSSSEAAYKLYSRGKDGVGSDCEASATLNFNDEICFAEGKFMRYPAGPQQ